MTPIEITGLCKTYRGKRGRKVVALRDLSLTVGQGEVFGFLGPNGAGKSTTIKTLVGQVRPSSGSVRLFGRSVVEAGARRNLGYLPENPALYDFLTGREYLEMVGRIFGLASTRLAAATDRALELMDLTAAGKRPIRGYSKGMVQRLGLAQALLHDPDLYILDEPMSGLDPVGRVLVKETIRDLKRQGKTVFFSTHVIADVEAVCDRVGIISAGQLQAVYEVEEVLRSGVEGYQVLVAGCPDGFLVKFSGELLGQGRGMVKVAKQNFQVFSRELFEAGGEIEVVEPQRRSLEGLFMDIVSGTR